MKDWYKGLQDRYATFSGETQVLHMVSDLKKAKSFADSSPVTSKNHLYRSIILLDYMINDPKWKGKLRELFRLRECIGSAIFHKKPFATLDQLITASLLMDPKAYKIYKGKSR